MAKFTDYTQKTKPADADLLLIHDNAGAANKKTPFSGVWSWILDKLASAVISQLETTNKSIIPAINELNSKKTQGDAKIVGLTNISSIKITNISSLYGSILITTNKDGYNNNPICALIYLNGKDNYGAIFITGNQDKMTVSYEEAELNINFNTQIHGSVILGGSISAGTEINTIY